MESNKEINALDPLPEQSGISQESFSTLGSVV